MSVSSPVHVQSQETSDNSFTSSGGKKPLVVNSAKNRCVGAFVVVVSLIFIWGIALLPAIFYANKLPVHMEHEQQENMR